MPKVGKTGAEIKASSPKSLWICEYCDKGFCFPSSLQRHQKVHTGQRPFPCNLCSYSAAEKHTLKNHIRSHLQEKLFKCPEPGCLFSAVTKSNLNDHELVHSQENPFSCPFSSCSYKTGRKNMLTRHMKTHQVSRVKPFQCDLCPFKTTAGFQLKTHKTHVHSTENRFKCDKEGCGYAGKSKGNLKLHLQTHDDKRLSCPHPTCEYKTNVNATLKLHMRIHSEESKKYKCLLCDYAGRHSGALISHMRIHTKESPYKCPVQGCSFQAKQSCNLNRHVKTRH